jgi:hypothetical protein
VPAPAPRACGVGGGTPAHTPFAFALVTRVSWIFLVGGVFPVRASASPRLFPPPRKNLQTDSHYATNFSPVLTAEVTR